MSPGVPFIRALSNEETVVQTIILPSDLEYQAMRFLAAGGRYFIALMPGGLMTKLASAFPKDGELQTVEERQAFNGPPLKTAIAELVRNSAARCLEVPDA